MARVVAVQHVLMAANRLVSTAAVSSSFLRRKELEWLATGENHDYFAEEILLVSEKERQAWTKAAQRSFELLLETAQTVIHEGRWSELGIPHNATRLIQYSIQRERDLFLIGRFDFAGGFGDFPIKMLEFNADTCSLMPETADVQRHLWEQSRSRPGKGPFDMLYPALTRQFAKLLRNYPDKEPALLLSTMGYEEDWLNVQVLADAAKVAGFKTVQLALLEDVIFDPENGVFVEVGPDQFQHFPFWYKMFPWDFIAYEEPDLMQLLSDLVQEDKLLVLNPAWTMVLQSKAILPFIFKQFPTELTQLAAGFFASDFRDGRYARKPIFGRTGENVALFDGQAAPLAQNEGDYGHLPMVYQELASFFTDIEGHRYQASVFYTDQPAALAFRRQDDPIIDDDAEYIGHTVT